MGKKNKYFRLFVALVLCISLILGNSITYADSVQTYSEVSIGESGTEENSETSTQDNTEQSTEVPTTEETTEEDRPIDMTNVTLATYDITSYLYPTYFYRAKPTYSPGVVKININSEYVFDDVYSNNFSVTSSNKKIKIVSYIINNTIFIVQNNNKAGKAVLTIKLYDKEFKVNYTSKKVDISDQSYLLVKGKTKKLKVTGYSGKIIWKSSNPKIASVNSKGVVKGKKYGNVIITAQIGDHYLGCAVSVTTKKIKNVCKRATYMGTHWKYSQAKRNEKGYYDCSSLVWKAYNEKAGVNFGSANWPSTADYEAFWCRDHKRMVKGGLSYSNLQKMKVNPGDLLFKSTNKKKKYDDIYHVEMFTGYYCMGVHSNGTPSYTPIWAARGTTYSFTYGSLLGRPMKY